MVATWQLKKEKVAKEGSDEEREREQNSDLQMSRLNLTEGAPERLSR